MSNVVRDPRLQTGTIQTSDFVVQGNYEAAYKYLKDMFEPKKKSSSGPIRPLTKEEQTKADNKPTVDMLEELPPSNYHQY